MAVPPSSVSATAVRRNEVTGVVQRRTSSTAVGISAGSAASRSSWSGCSARATSAPEMAFRVVSLPATRSWIRNMPELVVRQGLAVLLVGRQHRDDVVARLRPSGRGEGEELDGHLPEQGHAVVLRPVGGAGDGGLRPAEEPLLVARGQPEQLGDELDRERDRQLGGDVDDRAALRLGGERVEGGARALADEHLELAHDLVREPGSRQLAVAGVLRRIGVHHRRRGVVGDADLVDEDPA